MHKLVKIAEIYNVAIIVTNQVQSTPDTFFGDPTKPAGGNVIGHASTYRIYLRKAGNDRIAKIIDSPYHPYSDVRFTVNEKGVDDIDSDVPRKRTARKRRRLVRLEKTSSLPLLICPSLHNILSAEITCLWLYRFLWHPLHIPHLL